MYIQSPDHALVFLDSEQEFAPISKRKKNMESYFVKIVGNRFYTEDVIAVKKSNQGCEVRILTNLNPDLLRYQIIPKHATEGSSNEIAFAKWLMEASEYQISLDYGYNPVIKLWQHANGDYVFEDKINALTGAPKFKGLQALINAGYQSLNILHVAELACDVHYGITVDSLVHKLAHLWHFDMYTRAPDEQKEVFNRSPGDDIYRLTRELNGFVKNNLSINTLL